MNKDIINRPEIEGAEDIGLTSGIDDEFDNLSHAAENVLNRRKRFVLVCDATSSMGSWWAEAQKALKKAVDEISSRTDTPFQVKVVAYRDHTCDSQPKEESDWSNDTQYLQEFISGIRSTGGGDWPESIGIGLAPAVQSDASLVVLIGDAPGRDNSTGFEEAKQLGMQRCPVYAFYVNDNSRTVEHFEQIARLSGGKASHLKNASSMTDVFAALLARVVFQIAYQPTTEEGKAL